MIRIGFSGVLLCLALLPALADRVEILDHESKTAGRFQVTGATTGFGQIPANEAADVTLWGEGDWRSRVR